MSSIYSWLTNRRLRRDEFQKALRESDIADFSGDVSASDAQWVVGRARTAGVVGPSIDSGVYSQRYAPGDGARLKVRTIHTVTLVSQGELTDIERVWVNDVEAPIEGTAASRKWASSGWTLRDFATYGDVAGKGPLLARYNALKARMTALIPTWEPTSGTDTVVIPDDADTVVVALFDDLLAELNALLDSARMEWMDNRKTRKVAGGPKISAAEPVISVWASLGADSDAQAASPIQTYARTLSRWKNTDTFDEIAWALVRHRFWKRPGDTTEIAPWSRVPRVHYLARGGGLFDGTSAKFAQAVLLMGDREVDDLERLDDAVAWCAQKVTIDPVARGDAEGSKSVTGPEVLKHYYGDDLPATDVQDKVLAEWNAREAGADNARPRHSINRVFTSSEINSGEALEIAAECMGGRFVELTGKKVVFRPASPHSTIVAPSGAAPKTLAVGPSDRWEAPQWRLAKGDGQSPNALDARIRQDRERQYRPSTVPRSQLDDQVARDGLALRTRTADGKDDMLDVLRQNALLLERDDPDLREALVAVVVDSPTDPRGLLQPMDRVVIDAITCEVQSVQPMVGRTVYAVRELPSDAYADRFFIRPSSRDPGPGGGGVLDLSVVALARWRESPAGRLCDIEIWPGSDTQTVRVRASWDTKPTAEVQEYYVAVTGGIAQLETVQTGAPPAALPAKALGASPHVFVGDDRILTVELTGFGAEVSADGGGEVTELVLRSTPLGGTGVTWEGVSVNRYLENLKFAGWIVTVNFITVAEGDLAYSLDGGTTWTVPTVNPASYSSPAQENIFAQLASASADEHRIKLVIKNTFKLATGATMTLAARTGETGAYTYSSGELVDLAKYVPPADEMTEVAGTPTGSGEYVGQLVYTVEE